MFFFHLLRKDEKQRNGKYHCHCPLVLCSPPCFTFGPTLPNPHCRYLLTCQPHVLRHLSLSRFASLDSVSSVCTRKSTMLSLAFCLRTAASLCWCCLLREHIDGWVNREAVAQDGSADSQLGPAPTTDTHLKCEIGFDCDESDGSLSFLKRGDQKKETTMLMRLAWMLLQFNFIGGV